jgi:hypothetical protein
MKIVDLLEPMTPKTFDKNEVYIFFIILLVWILFSIIHKKEERLLLTEIVCLYVFNVLFATVGDRILAEPPLDFYDTLDYAHGEFFDIVLQLGVYPVPILIAVHFYRKYKPNIIIYTLLWACILAGLEWLSLHFFNLFQYKEWRTWYSFLFYNFATLVNLILSKWLKKIIENRQNREVT